MNVSSTIYLENFLALAKKNANGPRNYAGVVRLDGENEKMVWTDGYVILTAPYRGETKTITHLGMEANLTYPKYEGVLPDEEKGIPSKSGLSSNLLMCLGTQKGRDPNLFLGFNKVSHDVSISSIPSEEDKVFNPFLAARTLKGFLAMNIPITTILNDNMLTLKIGFLQCNLVSIEKAV